MHRLRAGLHLRLRQNLEEDVDHVRIERFARLLLQQRHRFFDRNQAVVHAFGRQSVEMVGDAQHPGAGWDLLTFQTGGITAAIPPLVVAEDDRGDRVRKRHVGDDRGADLRMDVEPLQLLDGQRTGLGEDVLRDGKLADIVQECRRLDRLDFALAHAKGPRERGGVGLNAAKVIVADRVFGIDRQDQRFDGRPMELGHPLGLAPADVEVRHAGAVPPERHIAERGNQQQAGDKPE
jgi:hypothetical protein